MDAAGFCKYLTAFDIFTVYTTQQAADVDDYEKDASLKGEFIRMVLGSELSQEQKAEVIRCGILALSGEQSGDMSR